jgi:hypothetical protein
LSGDLAFAGCKQQGGQQVESQERKVGQVVFGNVLIAQMGMDQAQPPQGSFPQRVVFHGRDDQSFFIPYNDIFHHAGTVDEYADLAADIRRELDEADRKFVGAEFGGRNATTVEPFDGQDLALPQASEIAEDFFDRMTPE